MNHDRHPTPMATQSAASRSLALAALMATALCMPAFADTSFSITTKFKTVTNSWGLPLGPGGGVALNNVGLVAGSRTMNTSARTYTYTEPGPLGFDITMVGTEYVLELYPVLVTNGVSRILPRLNGNTNAMGVTIADDGTMLVAVAPASGKRSRNENRSDYLPYLYKSGAYQSLGTATPWYQTVMNRQGWILTGTPVTNAYTLRHNGQVQTFSLPMAAGAIVNTVGSMDVSANGAALVSLSWGVVNTKNRCLVWSQGQVTEIAPPDEAWRIDCVSINASGAVAGIVKRYETSGLSSAAAFVWQAGQFQLQPFEADFTPIRLKLLASGALIYDKGPVFGPSSSGAQVVTGGGVLVRHGVATLIDSLLSPALPKGQYLSISDVNDRGQLLASVYGAPGTPQYVWSPSAGL